MWVLLAAMELQPKSCSRIARNYVSVLNVMKAASNASRPELSTAEKVGLESEGCAIWIMMSLSIDMSG